MNTLIKPEHSLANIWDLLQLEFKKATIAKRHPFKLVVVSSSKNGAVNSRWVVFRKYTEHESFLIFTDARSAKVQELKENSEISLLFYNDRKKLQVGVNGKVVIHHKDGLTDKYWPGVNGHSDHLYTSQLSPGTPINNPNEGYNWNAEMNDENFMILEIIPKVIDVLQLNGKEHIRSEFIHSDQGWKGSFLVP